MENQHGDCLFENVKVIPEGAEKKDLIGIKSFTIEKGEGVNTHELVSETNDLSDLMELYEHEGNLYVRVKKGCQIKIKHQEHGEQILKEGIHKKVIEREYDYEKNEERKVLD